MTTTYDEKSIAFVDDADFDVREHLAAEEAKDLLRFSTAGSVDDGKSTLIGRLLYDTRTVYDDQLRSIEGKGTTAPGVLDLALLTDGLRAEREQGITIDVAYRYFSTPRRRFIIADTPGHAQYTRNMATGASTADVAIVLVDARKGVLEQSRRHAYIAALLGVQHVIVAVNKMDLVDYAEDVFTGIREDFTKFFAALDRENHSATELHFIPVSALAGDNVVHTTDAMPWYTGPSLLTLLESLPASVNRKTAPFRLAVQRVTRPNLDFRGFAGQIAAGSIRPGDKVLVLPSGQSSRVERIVTFDGDLPEATAPQSITLTLEDEIDISRGDLLVAVDAPASVTSVFTASLVWMDASPLDLTRRYLLKHAARVVSATVSELLSRVELSGSEDSQPQATLAMNDIGVVAVRTLLPIVADPYSTCHDTGSFILIDPQSNATVAAGMIRSTVTAVGKEDVEGASVADAIEKGGVKVAERTARYGHSGAHLVLHSPVKFAEALERVLFDRGAHAVLFDGEESSIRALTAAGLLVITARKDDNAASELHAEISGTRIALPLHATGDFSEAVKTVLQLLQRNGVLRQGESL